MYLWKEGLIKFSYCQRFLAQCFRSHVRTVPIEQESAISWLSSMPLPLLMELNFFPTMTPTEQVIILYHPFEKIMTEMV